MTIFDKKIVKQISWKKVLGQKIINVKKQFVVKYDFWTKKSKNPKKA